MKRKCHFRNLIPRLCTWYKCIVKNGKNKDKCTRMCNHIVVFPSVNIAKMFCRFITYIV